MADGRSGRSAGLGPFPAGLLAIVIIGVASFFAFTKANPFHDPFKLRAEFETANNLKANSPVRIAGVDVGKVTKVEAKDDGSGHAMVEFEVDERGLPIHKDAELKVRPRIFLEGNFFLDVRTGSPSAPKLEDGDTVGIEQTAAPVQFGQLLTALQSDTRKDLQDFLKEYSTALDKGGARGFNRSIRYWEGAYKNTSLANIAFLGTRPGDLGRVLRGQQQLAEALARDPEALKGLVTNFNRTAAAFAREDVALARTIPALRGVLATGRPALDSLNAALPSLRAFSIEALPGVRSSGPAIDASLPTVRQLRRLFTPAELRGLVRDLRPTIPDLARLNRDTIPFLGEQRQLSRCTTHTLVPFATKGIPDPDFPGQSGEPWYKQGPRAFVGLAGESRVSDANSPQFRVQFGGGPTTIVQTGPGASQLFSQVPFDLIGNRPARPNRRPDFRPDIPCETQDPPDLNAPLGSGNQQQLDLRTRANRDDEDFKKLYAASCEQLDQTFDHYKRLKARKPTVDPLSFNIEAQNMQLKEYGLKRNSKGKIVKEDEKEDALSSKELTGPDWAPEIQKAFECDPEKYGGAPAGDAKPPQDAGPAGSGAIGEAKP
jgi:phospholipid/cholesterol/gamma-HCH transport system substrate-binding protein